jgi:hypothetical protein
MPPALPPAWPLAFREDLDDLHRALHLHRNEVIPIVGSGLSRGLTSWTDFLRGLISRLSSPMDQTDLTAIADDKQWFDVASRVEDLLGASQVQGRIRSAFDLSRLSASERASKRPPTYDTLVTLPCDGFVTTNWDPFLEDALTLRLGHSPRLITPGRPASLSAIPGGAAWVFKAHGDAQHDEPCLLTNRHFAALRTDHAWMGAMSRVLGGQPLFLGYSVDDPHVRAMLEDFTVIRAGGPPRGWWLGKLHSDAQRKKLQNDVGLHVLNYEDHARLPDILTILATP